MKKECYGAWLESVIFSSGSDRFVARTRCYYSIQAFEFMIFFENGCSGESDKIYGITLYSGLSLEKSLAKVKAGSAKDVYQGSLF